MRCLHKFELKGQYVLLNLTIVRDINADVPNFLFGNDSLRKTFATQTYKGDVEPSPEIRIKRQMELKLNTYFESPRNLLTCKAEYNLGPYSTALVTVLLEPAAPVIRTDEILISSINWSSIQIL